ncbi:MAG: NAD-dependent epimerase/dehydratase family protein [Planctomycetaceae bacterium]
MSTTLVIGGNGFIGSQVVRNLLREGHTVRCLVRKTSRTDRLDGLNLELVHGDLRDAESLYCACVGCASIVHLGGISAWSQIASPEMFPVVVEGTRNVLAAAKANGVKRLVYVSSAAALGPCFSPLTRGENAPFSAGDATGMIYVLAKREAENLCLNATADGLEAVIVRPAEVYGPDDRDLVTAGNLVEMLRSSPVLVCAGGTSVIHVQDAANGIVRALMQGRSGEVYLLGGENLHHRELAGLLLELANRQASIVTVPASLLRFGASMASMLHLPFPIPPPVVPYATRYWFVDSTKAQRELGIRFRSARETLSDTLTWLKSTGTV